MITFLRGKLSGHVVVRKVGLVDEDEPQYQKEDCQGGATGGEDDVESPSFHLPCLFLPLTDE